MYKVDTWGEGENLVSSTLSELNQFITINLPLMEIFF